MGLVWSFFNPVLMLSVYTFVFSMVFQARWVGGSGSKVEFAMILFSGLTAFNLFAENINRSPTLILGNVNYVKKVVFPLEILPVAQVGAAAFHLMISLVLALISLVLFDRSIHPELLWLPVIIAPLLLLGMGIAWFFSAVGVFFRDIGQVMQFLSLALMYASAVFYSAAKIPPEFWTFLRFNPLLLAIELARNTGLWAQPINLHHLLYLYAVGLLACVLGHYAFRRMKPAFADVI